MKSALHLKSSLPPLRTKKPDTSLVSETLTNSEIEQLQRNKRALSDYARKAFAARKARAK